jgi:uncharacterized protein (TIGR02270 family)
MIATRDADILWDVVEQHLREAAFLWTQWERALVAPSGTLNDVIRGPEERLLAHVDGLVLAEEPAVERLLVPALDGYDADNVFAAALALLDGPTKDAFARVMARVEAEPEMAVAIERALALAHRPGIHRELLDATRSERAPRVAVALAALATRRVPVPDIGSFLASRDGVVLAPALAAARVGGQRHVAYVERAFGSAVPAVRDAALETGLVLGMRSAWETCRRLVDEKCKGARFALLVLAMSGEEGDFQRIVATLDVERLRASAVVALGYTGRVAAVEACLRCLADGADEKLARLAGEAVSAITGLEIDGPFRRDEQEIDGAPPFEKDDLDANLVPGPEAMLPVPQLEAVERWWKDIKRRFDPAVRYLGGKQWSAERLVSAFTVGAMRRRYALGLELAIRSRGEYDVETWGWARDQRESRRDHRPPANPGFAQSFGKMLRA